MIVRIHNFNNYYNININIPNDIFIQKFYGIPKVIDKNFFIVLNQFKYSNYVLTCDLKSNELNIDELNSIIDSLKITPIMDDFTLNKDGSITVNITKLEIIYRYTDKTKLRNEKLQQIKLNMLNKQKS
mgnify:CR=1 FL=1